MATIPSTPDTSSISRRSKFMRSLSTLVAVAVALVLIGTVILFTITSRSQQAHQPQTTTITGAAPHASQTATGYVYQQSGLPIYDLHWSPDSSTLAAGGVSADNNNGVVNVWKVVL